SYDPSRARLLIRDSVSPVSPAWHSPLWFPRNLASIRGAALSKVTQTYPGSDQYRHAAPRKRLLRRGDSPRALGRHLHGHDTARRTRDGNAFWRSGSRDRRCYFDKGRPIDLTGGGNAEHAIRFARCFWTYQRYARPAGRTEIARGPPSPRCHRCLLLSG